MATTNDPSDLILEEIHKTRSAMLNQHGGIAGLAAFLRNEEANTDREIANPTRRNGQDESAEPIRQSRRNFT